MSDSPSASGGAGQTPQWSSQFAFLMAAIGSAVGLGNLWRFPFQAGQNGGSAFVFVYLISVVLIAYPVLMSEFSIGRHKGLSAVGSTKQLAIDIGKSPRWSIVGWVGVIASFLILTTYSVIAGQVLAYSLMSFFGEFAGQSPNAAAQTVSLYAGSVHAVLWHTLFMLITIFIVTRGLKGGIERVVTILMPMFFVMLVGLSIYAMATGAADEAIAYLFSPRFSELRPDIALAAMGQAFFSIGVGSAIMITYGSFLDRSVNIGKNASIIAGADTMVAIVAGLMIFPIVFAFSLDPGAGAGLIFSALPAVFAGMPAGAIIGGLFFFLAFIAAVTSSISLLMVVSSAIEDQFNLSAKTSAWAVGGVIWAVGVATIMKSGFGPFLDFLSGSVFLPLGGLFVAVFAGWIVPRTIMRDELHNTSDGIFRYWRFMIRYLAPIAISVILILGLDASFNFGLNTMLARLAGG